MRVLPIGTASAVMAILLLAPTLFGADEPIIADHICTDLPSVPAAAIDQAKANLHIAYGHTSHGSQVTSGMTGLVTFTGGCGGPQFAWNNGGTGGALDLHDYAMGGDCGYYPQWVNNTRDYLNDPANADVNVIIWSWCGQISGYTSQDLIDKYLAPMDQLETDYPHVTFVYMTGHLNYWQKANTDARNQQVRDFCLANNKVLFDFADIESWNPDGVFFEYAHDNCDYWDAGGTKLGNWAIEWQNSHVQGVDWYNCSSAHSQPLNANLKAYAVWWLWARLGGWAGHEPLAASGDTISAATGGTIDFDLDAGADRQGREYLILGSTSGTTPGTPLPGGQTVLPLNWDPSTGLMLSMVNTTMFHQFMGTLDPEGKAAAQLAMPNLPAHLVGLTVHFAYTLHQPFDFVSNTVPVTVEP